VCWINVNCDDDSRTFVITVKLMKSKSCYFQSGNFPWAHGLLFFLINRHAYNLSLITLNPETSSPRRCKSFLTVFFLYLPFGLTSRRQQPAAWTQVCENQTNRHAFNIQRKSVTNSQCVFYNFFRNSRMQKIDETLWYTVVLRK